MMITDKNVMISTLELDRMGLLEKVFDIKDKSLPYIEVSASAIVKLTINEAVKIGLIDV